jgi:HAE1 family hydrophobic/amphiphilic exporter-1
VKNGIMLLDFLGASHQNGESFEAAIAHAGRIRLRPILMTTFCTLFGLLPLALGLGAGAELQNRCAGRHRRPTLSTPVTLLVVPGLYAAIKKRGRPALGLPVSRPEMVRILKPSSPASFRCSARAFAMRRRPRVSSGHSTKAP